MLWVVAVEIPDHTGQILGRHDPIGEAMVIEAIGGDAREMTVDNNGNGQHRQSHRRVPRIKEMNPSGVVNGTEVTMTIQDPIPDQAAILVDSSTQISMHSDRVTHKVNSLSTERQAPPETTTGVHGGINGKAQRGAHLA